MPSHATTLSASHTRPNSEAAAILSAYSRDEQKLILHRLESCATISNYAGQDFEMTVLLNKPGAGWHWNFEKNEVRVDPETLLRAPLEVSQAIFYREGLHRRITPKEVGERPEWKQPGFPFLVNSIEDPRIENFGVEAYPAYRTLRDASYRYHQSEVKQAAREQAGRVPLHIEAGLELISCWFDEVAPGDKGEKSPRTVDPRVKQFVDTVLKSAGEAWWAYPSRREADWMPETIPQFFDQAFEIIRDKIWPEFQKLYEVDREEQLLSQAAGEAFSQGENDSTLPLEGPITDEQLKTLIDAIKNGEITFEKSSDATGNAKPLDLSQVSDELKRELAELLAKLPAKELGALQEQADQSLVASSKEASEILEGKSIQLPEASESVETVNSDMFEGIDLSQLRKSLSPAGNEIDEAREKFEKFLDQDLGLYDNTVREVSGVINRLEQDLYAIFQKRRQNHVESGKRIGTSLNINRYISERASGKHPIDTRALEQKTKALQKDHSIVVLVDVSGSMKKKIHSAFAATVACTEALSGLGISHAIFGFNDNFYTYKPFDTEQDKDTLCKIEQDVRTPEARYNNDGWALSKTVELLNHREEKEKILIVLSDGEPIPSARYSGEDFKLERITAKIEDDGGIRLIGLGIGSGTDHVAKYYRFSRANLAVENLAQELCDAIKEAIER